MVLPWAYHEANDPAHCSVYATTEVAAVMVNAVPIYKYVRMYVWIPFIPKLAAQVGSAHLGICQDDVGDAYHHHFSAKTSSDTSQGQIFHAKNDRSRCGKIYLFIIIDPK